MTYANGKSIYFYLGERAEPFLQADREERERFERELPGYDEAEEE